MGRNTGTFNFSANFEPKIEAALDARMTVDLYADLINPATWEDEDNLVWLYNGAIVAVGNDPDISKRGIYVLIDSANYTNPDNWKMAGTGTDVSIFNIGDGSAGVFAGYDVSGNILLRTFKGSGGATVTQTSEEIVIGIDASFSGEVNYGENVGTGDVSIYQEKSGDELRFRTLKAGDNISLSYEDSQTIRIDSSGGGIDGSIYTSQVEYDPSLNPTLEMPQSVGGIPAGTTVAELDGDSVKEILNDLLFPTVEPTYQNPNNSFTENAAAYYEVNDTTSISFTATLDRGQILLNGSFQDFRSGPPNSYFYTDPSANSYGPVDVSTSVNPDVQTPGTYLVTQGIQTWTSRIAYDQGPQPLDNKGAPTGSPWPAGTTNSKSVSLEGVYPLFATTVDINTLTKQNLISMSTSVTPGYTLVAETGGAKQQFEIPDKWTDINPLVGVQTYNSFAGAWEFQGGSASASLTSWTTTPTSQTIQGVNENYTLYTYNGVDRGSIEIRLIF